MKAARAAFNRAKHDADALAARCKRAEDHLREIEMEVCVHVYVWVNRAFVLQ